MQVQLAIGNKNYSSWSLRAWLVLREANIPFEEKRIVLDAPETAEALESLNAARRVPVLVIDGEVIWDSLAIAETVAERWPDRNLWPADAAMRAHARAISAEMHAEARDLLETVPMQ